MPSIGNGPKKSDKAVTIAPNAWTTCDKIITPDCLRALYNINYTPVATDKNTFGVGGPDLFAVNMLPLIYCLLVEFTPQAFFPGDLDLFFRFDAKFVSGNVLSQYYLFTQKFLFKPSRRPTQGCPYRRG